MLRSHRFFLFNKNFKTRKVLKTSDKMMKEKFYLELFNFSQDVKVCLPSGHNGTGDYCKIDIQSKHAISLNLPHIFFIVATNFSNFHCSHSFCSSSGMKPPTRLFTVCLFSHRHCARNAKIISFFLDEKMKSIITLMPFVSFHLRQKKSF